MRWKTRDETVFNGHENRDHGVYIRSMKFPSSLKGLVFMDQETFTKHWKLISWPIMGHQITNYLRLKEFMTPESAATS